MGFCSSSGVLLEDETPCRVLHWPLCPVPSALESEVEQELLGAP